MSQILINVYCEHFLLFTVHSKIVTINKVVVGKCYENRGYNGY